jgi:hypothetical protein
MFVDIDGKEVPPRPSVITSANGTNSGGIRLIFCHVGRNLAHQPSSWKAQKSNEGHIQNYCPIQNDMKDRGWGNYLNCIACYQMTGGMAGEWSLGDTSVFR